MLPLGWLDGYTFIPIDFSLLSSNNSQINRISEKIDKRTCGYKRRKNALQSAPEQIPDMGCCTAVVNRTSSRHLKTNKKEI